VRATLQATSQIPNHLENQEDLFSRLLTKLNSLWVVATYPFGGKGRNLSLHYASDISRCLAPYIWLGNCVEIGRHAWFHTWSTSGIESDQEIKITIEDDCCIAARCTISAKNSIHLERNVKLASDVLVMDHNHAYEDVSAPIWRQGVTPGGRITIGEGCRIGRGAAILCDKGELVLGRNCVVNAGAVVTRSFPPDSVLSGNPARAKRKSDLTHALGPQTHLSDSNQLCAAAEPKQVAEHDSDAALFASGKQVIATKQLGAKQDSSESDLTLYSQHAIGEEDPLSWFSRLAGKLWTLWLARTYRFASFGKGAWAHYSFGLARSAAPYISIGQDSGFARDVRLDVCAVPGTVSPVIIMDDRSGLQRRCVISARNHIHVMRDVIFGPSVLVTDHHYDSEDHDRTGQEQEPRGGTIRIDEECWIGFGSVIVCEQGELTIGRHSVVGANSVVRRSIPPYSVVAGDPARIVKQYDFSQGKWVLGCIRPPTRTDRTDPVHAGGAPS
jgi:acetyltransferase-like isoleucine patch superfamily enzyme